VTISLTGYFALSSSQLAMPQRVILSLGNGSLQEGFRSVQARFRQDAITQMQVAGSLPPAPELEQLMQRWSLLYTALNQSLSPSWQRTSETETRSLRLEVAEAGETNISATDLVQLRNRLITALNQWLQAKSFRDIDQKLRDYLTRTEEIQFLIETDIDLFQKLPWQEWDFFDNHPNAEIALCAPNHAPPDSISPPRDRLKVLILLGDSQGIDIEQDKRDWQVYQREKPIQLEILNQPTVGQLHESLWQREGWDILFFAGHSSGKGGGVLRLNPQERISMENLRHELRYAIQNGLKLAIFNSCDGLALATALADLHIPQVIVMREVVSDAIAHRFLKTLLAEFFRGTPLYPSLRLARERLNNAHNVPPCADWLPILFQNPAVDSLTLPMPSCKVLSGQPSFSQTLNRKIPSPEWQTVTLVSLGIALLTIGIRLSGLLQPFDHWAFDTLQRSKLREKIDPRIVVVTITDQDTPPRYVQAYSLTDKRLANLLRTLNSYQPRVIGLDIKRPKPIGTGNPDSVDRKLPQKRGRVRVRT
jgi:hypothetical protein